MTDHLNPTGSFTLTNNDTGESYELSSYSPTHGPNVIDIRKLYSQAKAFTFDPSFTSTASCTSSLTFIDGEQGVLLHRGYTIEDLTEKASFLEVAHLLLYGELPNIKRKKWFEKEITYHTMVHEQLNYFFRGFRRDAHPMAIMCGAVGGLSSFYHDSLDIACAQQRETSANRLVAKVSTLAAMTYKYTIGQPFVYPRNDLNYAENFLHMCFAVPSEPYTINPVVAKAVDKIFTLHADHEQNASTSTVRLAGSSQANPFACVAAGIASLWGASHGGANQAVLEMLGQIGTKDRIADFIERAKDKDDPFRLMGFGHRVYKNTDPRAEVLKQSAHDVLEALGVKNDPLLEIAVELEKIALEDPYFIDRKLFPNVDFYSGIILKAIGFPTNMFTVLFALARTVGWVAQWKEMIEDPAMRIARPRQLYTGPAKRAFIPLDKRD